MCQSISKRILNPVRLTMKSTITLTNNGVGDHGDLARVTSCGTTSGEWVGDSLGQTIDALFSWGQVLINLKQIDSTFLTANLLNELGTPRLLVWGAVAHCSWSILREHFTICYYPAKDKICKPEVQLPLHVSHFKALPGENTTSWRVSQGASVLQWIVRLSFQLLSLPFPALTCAVFCICPHRRLQTLLLSRHPTRYLCKSMKYQGLLLL